MHLSYCTFSDSKRCFYCHLTLAGEEIPEIVVEPEESGICLSIEFLVLLLMTFTLILMLESLVTGFNIYKYYLCQKQVSVLESEKSGGKDKISLKDENLSEASENECKDTVEENVVTDDCNQPVTAPADVATEVDEDSDKGISNTVNNRLVGFCASEKPRRKFEKQLILKTKSNSVEICNRNEVGVSGRDDLCEEMIKKTNVKDAHIQHSELSTSIKELKDVNSTSIENEGQRKLVNGCKSVQVRRKNPGSLETENNACASEGVRRKHHYSSRIATECMKSIKNTRALNDVSKINRQSPKSENSESNACATGRLRRKNIIGTIPADSNEKNENNESVADVFSRKHKFENKVEHENTCTGYMVV